MNKNRQKSRKSWAINSNTYVTKYFMRNVRTMLIGFRILSIIMDFCADGIFHYSLFIITARQK